ncbi:hypothetical protein [Methylobacterium sp. Gmos1]
MGAWYSDLGDAGFPVPGSFHKPIDRLGMILVCAMLAGAMEMARGGPGMVDVIDVQAIFGGAFG